MEKVLDFTEQINAYFSALEYVFATVNREELSDTMNVLLEAWRNEAAVYCFGNGGSAATASHMLNDFNKGVSYELEKKFRFNCLNDNVAILTALANDVGYEYIYVKQLEGKLREGDLIVAISGSGNSPNVLRAAQYAKAQGCPVIGITGYDGGRLGELADYHMHVPSSNMQIVEDIHMIFNHMMMKIFYETMKNGERERA